MDTGCEPNLISSYLTPTPPLFSPFLSSPTSPYLSSSIFDSLTNSHLYYNYHQNDTTPYSECATTTLHQPLPKYSNIECPTTITHNNNDLLLLPAFLLSPNIIQQLLGTLSDFKLNLIYQQQQQSKIPEKSSLLSGMCIPQLIPHTTPSIDNEEGNEQQSSCDKFKSQFEKGQSQQVCKNKDEHGRKQLTIGYLPLPQLPPLPPPDIAKPADSTCSGSAPVNFSPLSIDTSTKSQLLKSKLLNPYQCNQQPQSLGFKRVIKSATLEQQQLVPNTQSIVKTNPPPLNYSDLKSNKDMQDLLRLADIHLNHSSSKNSITTSSSLQSKSCDNSEKNKSSMKISLCDVMPGVHRYLESLKIPVDIHRDENYALFFARKATQSNAQIFSIAPIIAEDLDAFSSEENCFERGTTTTTLTTPSLESSLRKQVKLDQSDASETPSNPCGVVQLNQPYHHTVQNRFVDARRNKKRDAKAESTLKQNEQLSMKFHNLTRLLMYKITRMFLDETQDSLLQSRFDISSSFLAHLRSVVRKIKQHSKDTCKNAVKTNFYTHTHYNALFLTLTPENLAAIAKNPKDVHAHAAIFGLDVQNADPIVLAHANLIKHVAFEIVKVNLSADSMQRDSSESINIQHNESVGIAHKKPSHSAISTAKSSSASCNRKINSELSKSNSNLSDAHLSNIRTLYFERAFVGIKKMNQGLLVSRF